MFHSKTRRSLAMAALSLLVVLLAPSRAGAQCDPPGVTVAVTTTGAFTKSCSFNATTGRWDITVTLTGNPTSNPTITITGGSNVMLGRVRVQNNTAIDCRVNIRGTSALGRIGGLGAFDKGTSGTDKVLLLQLYTAGDVGYDREAPPNGTPGGPAIRADMIYNLDVGGSMLGDMVSTAAGRSMGNVFIAGNLLGGVSIGNSASIDQLDVMGDIRRPDGEPVSISVPGGHIGRLKATSIAANIVLGPGGVVHHFETTGGDFRGSLEATYLYEFGTSGSPRFIVARDLDASLSLAASIRVPITVGRHFKASRTVGGVQVPNVVWSARGYFDTNISQPQGSFAIVGNLEGVVHMGTPLNPARGSFNRDLVVGGAVLGEIIMDHHLNANVSFNGPVLGNITVGRSVLPGRMISIGGSGLEGGASLRIGDALQGTVVLPPGGLMGHIVINANNNGAAWEGPVSLGGLMQLEPAPYYNALSSITGGGSAGLVPFGLHAMDCTPPQGGVVASTAFAAPQPAVLIRSYGPVDHAVSAGGGGWGGAVAVERFHDGSWVNASSFFAPALFPPGAQTSHIIGLWGTGAEPPPGQYRVRPVALVCADVPGEPPVAWPTPGGYQFTIDADCDANGVPDSVQLAANPGLDANGNGLIDSCEGGQPTCPCDADGDGAVVVNDIFAFLSLWFSNSPQADFDGQNGVQVADIFAFLDCWFSRPPPCN